MIIVFSETTVEELCAVGAIPVVDSLSHVSFTIITGELKDD